MLYIVVVNKKEYKCRDAATLRKWKREKRINDNTPVWDRLERIWTTVGQAILVRPADGSSKKIYLS
tara:strand:- start:18694 stop:18891 length:198 start_codon:yes stop_codon:yes gene_type:complete